MKRWGSSAFKFDNFSTTERRFMHLKAFKCHDDFCGKEVSVTIIQLKCKVESKPDQDEFCFPQASYLQFWSAAHTQL